MSTVDRMSAEYEPRWDIDSEIGRQGELFVANVVESMKQASVEVKADEKYASTGNVYIEMWCLYGDEWRPSGILGTQAELWAHVLTREVAVVVPVKRLQELVRGYHAMNRYRAECMRGSHPTIGVAVPLPRFMQDITRGIEV